MINKISILDCTLRDGGYVNDFNFGNTVIKSIISKLSKANIDIIECGWLKSGTTDENRSRYSSIEVLKNVIGIKNPNLMYVAMIQYGAISNDEVAPLDPASIDGIRITFHEHEIDDAFVLGKQLLDKGYKVFMQPVGTTSYSDGALINLIEKINSLNPFAFYLVDTLGTMYKNDLLRMFYLIDHNLNKGITFGFHSHNNLQLSFANAQELMGLSTSRNIILDSSVYGMGRGAGNLNTELLTQYINSVQGLKYDNLEVLEILDEYIKPLSLKYKWGYDAAYYIASITGCHPNYASFLLNKQTLHIQDINAILNNLDVAKRDLYDKTYIGEEYIKYMSRYVDDQSALSKINDWIGDRQVLLLAPGKSLRNSTNKINNLIINNKYCVISVNFKPTDIKTDMMFISNIKRFSSIEELINKSSVDFKIVATSNILTENAENIAILNYSSYINEEQCIVDNAGLMCINLLKKIGVTEITLAGFDGFSVNSDDNFYKSSLKVDVETERLLKMNKATAEKLKQLSSHIKINYFSNSAYKE